MEQLVFELASKQGVWAILFISLFYYQLKDCRRREQDSLEREAKVLEFITEITKQFEGLVKQYERLVDDVQDIKYKIDH